MSIWRMVVMLAAAIVAVGNAILWFTGLIACGLREGQAPGFYDDFCGTAGTPGAIHLALLSALLLPGAAALSRRTEREWILLLAIAGGIAIACVIWGWNWN